MTSHYDIVSIELCLDYRNDEHIILCKFGGHIKIDFEVIEERFRSPPPGHRKQETENAQYEKS